MNDRELLELAALAAGMEVAKGVRDPLSRVWANGKVWNPLTDDGDALRLAVKLQIQVTPGTYNKDEFTAFCAGHAEAHEFYHYQQDELASTRRVIVRAAAEIGRKFPTLGN